MELQTIDVRNVCRCCILPSNDLESIFDSFFESESLATILENISRIKVTSEEIDISTSICQNCKLAAINALKFQQMCIETDKNLRYMIASYNNSSNGNFLKKHPVTNSQDQEQVLIIEKQEEVLDRECLIIEKQEHEEFEENVEEEVLLEEINGRDEEDEEEMDYEASEDDSENEQQKRKSGISNEESYEEEDNEDDNKKEYSCTQCSKVFKRASLLVYFLSILKKF